MIPGGFNKRTQRATRVARPSHINTRTHGATVVPAMSQEHGAPVPEVFVPTSSTAFVSPGNRKDLCACCDRKVVDCGTCCFGCFCPFVLIGSSHAMKENGFTKRTDLCSGCGDEACLGVFFGNVLGDACFASGLSSGRDSPSRASIYTRGPSATARWTTFSTSSACRAGRALVTRPRSLK